MSGIDLGQVGAWLGSAGLIASGVWTWWVTKGQTAAKARATIAEASAESAVADAQSTVYNMLTERVVTLENDMRIVRQELAEERQHSRRLVLHIWKLEQLMRAAGLEVPAFVDGEVSASLVKV
jgi:hypothetical protein